MKIYDISVTLDADTPVYEGDSPIEIIAKERMDNGGKMNITQLYMSAHSGTHIDAPFHFNQNGKKIDELPLEIFFGTAQVIKVTAESGFVTRAELIDLVAPRTERLLIKTANSKLWGNSTFVKGFVALSLEAAFFLVEKKIKLVGIDYLSVESFYSNDNAVHRMLFENSVVALEGLNLTDVPPGTYQLICLPLRIKGGDGSPTRAILIAD